MHLQQCFQSPKAGPYAPTQFLSANYVIRPTVRLVSNPHSFSVLRRFASSRTSDRRLTPTTSKRARAGQPGRRPIECLLRQLIVYRGKTNGWTTMAPAASRHLVGMLLGLFVYRVCDVFPVAAMKLSALEGRAASPRTVMRTNRKFVKLVNLRYCS